MPACVYVLSRSRRCATKMHTAAWLTHRPACREVVHKSSIFFSFAQTSILTNMKQFSFEAVKGAFTGRRQSSSSIMHVDGNHPQEGIDITMTVPTFSSITEAEEVDISNYTQDDLERLRLEDPFLYYSIPAMKRNYMRVTNLA